jgi:multiple sugar transport system permease protein
MGQGLRALYYRTKLAKWLNLFLALLISGLFVAPLFWMFRISFTARRFMFTLPPVPLSESATLAGYISLLQLPEFLRYYLNSVIVAFGTVALALIAGTLAAYSFSKFRYRGRNSLMLFALSAQMFPWAMLLISLYLLFNKVQMLNTYGALILTHTTFALPLTIWIMKGFFDTIPGELLDSAAMDGCSRLRTLASIVMPISRPGVVAAGIYIFIFSWNDFIFGLTLMSTRNRRPLTVGVALTFLTERQTYWSEMMASAVIVTIPLVILFLLLQRHFIAGLTAGAMKE